MNTTTHPQNFDSPGPATPANLTMRAITQDRYGSSDTWQLTEIDRPEIEDHEVLLHVHAAGLDRGTWHEMTGRPYLMRMMGFGLRSPKNRVPGRAVAGTVAGVGAKVTRFRVGDEVFGVSRGAFAEYAAAREDKLAHKPSSLTLEESAAVPISATTALQGLRLGSNRSRQYDLILDIAGNTTLRRLRRALDPAGSLVIVGGESKGNLTGGIGRSLRAPLVSLFVRPRLTMLTSSEHHADLAPLTDLIDTGKLTPCIEATYTLDEAHDAMRQLEAGKVRGKVLITL